MVNGPDTRAGYAPPLTAREHEAPEVHRAHTAILRTTDRVVGERGIRRFPGGNVFVTSPEVGRELLVGHDNTRLRKKTAINAAIGATVGEQSILSTPAHTQVETTMHARGKMVEFFRGKRKDYLEGVEAGTAELCDQILADGGVDNVYEKIHGVFVGGLLNTLGESEAWRDPELQQEIVGLSSELGVKTLAGTDIGERIITGDRGPKAKRYERVYGLLDRIARRKSGFWDPTTEGELDEDTMKSNVMLLLGAGTTSTAAAVGWSLYDAAYSDADRAVITTPNNKPALTNLMARSLSRHPFGVVINRRVQEDFTAEDFKFRDGDTVWFLTIPDRNRSTNTNDLLGLSFAAGPRDCLGKNVAIGSYLAFMENWGDKIKDWDVSKRPTSPLYMPGMKPKKMSLVIPPNA